MYVLGRGYAWLDTGTMESLYEAGEFVRSVERSQVCYLCAGGNRFEQGWITKEALVEAAHAYGKSNYGKHLQQVADERLIVSGRGF